MIACDSGYSDLEVLLAKRVVLDTLEASEALLLIPRLLWEHAVDNATAKLLLAVLGQRPMAIMAMPIFDGDQHD